MTPTRTAKRRRGARQVDPALLKRPEWRTIAKAIALTPDPDNADQPISERQFAIQVLEIDERTLRRYKGGEIPIRPGVVKQCQAIIDMHAAENRAATKADA